MLDLLIQYSRRAKEEVENWRQRTRHPSVPVRFSDRAQDLRGVLGLIPLSFLSVKRAVWHTLADEQDGEEVPLLS